MTQTTDWYALTAGVRPAYYVSGAGGGLVVMASAGAQAYIGGYGIQPPVGVREQSTLKLKAV